MSGFRSEYTQFEWLQMGLFLIGMPIAALLGSLLGLVGKWKQGRVVTAALVGLGSAAAVSLVLFLTFLLFFTVFFDARGEMIVGYFNQVFGRQVTWMPLLCAAVIACLAGIGLRKRPREETSRLMSVSMRQLLLLQVFTFATLGCWTGLRMMAMERLTTMERARRSWAEAETWYLMPDKAGEPRGLSANLQGPLERNGVENQRFVKALKEPWLKELNLWGINDLNSFELEKLKDAKQLGLVDWRFSNATPLHRKLFDALGASTSVREVGFWRAELGELDPSTLKGLSRLRMLCFGESTLSAETMREALTNAKLLETLSIYECKFDGDDAFEHLPTELKVIYLRQLQHPINSSLASLGKLNDLQSLVIIGGKLSRPEMEQIASLRKVETLHLDCQMDVDDLDLLKDLKAVKELWVVQTLPQKEERLTYRETIGRLAMIPSLEKLYVTFDSILKPTEGDWDAIVWNDETNKDLEKRCEDIGRDLLAVRKKLGLGIIQLSFGGSESNRVAPGKAGGSGGS